MIQYIIRKMISIMGIIYVFLDSFLKHETKIIMGNNIDNDFKNMNRRELCRHIENKFNWEKDSFWNLESTQKIRLCCQIARNIISGEEE
tara:strand:+ start:5024 stop:5290 length:267 start_codon:yes stop_codon:yes gene_type:complete